MRSSAVENLRRSKLMCVEVSGDALCEEMLEELGEAVSRKSDANI